MSQRRLIILALVAISLATGIAIYHMQPAASGPQAIAWDRENCTECHMLIGDRHFAAQLQTADGRTLNFDDAACLIRYVEHQRPAVRATYFRNSGSGGWLTLEQSGFVPVKDSPMGGGLAAVPASTPGALSYDQARRQIEGAHSGKGDM